MEAIPTDRYDNVIDRACLLLLCALIVSVHSSESLADESPHRAAWETPTSMSPADVEWAFNAPEKDLILLISNNRPPSHGMVEDGRPDLSHKREALLAILTKRNADKAAAQTKALIDSSEEVGRQTDALLRYTWWLLILTFILSIPIFLELSRWIGRKLARIQWGERRRSSRRRRTIHAS